MENTDYTVYSVSELNIKKSGIAKKLHGLREVTKGQVEELLHTILPDWEVLCFSDYYIRFGFKTGKVCDNGTPDYQDLSCYFGTRYGSEEFKVEINTSCFGSFDLNNADLREVRYYAGVGAMLTSDTFRKGLYDLTYRYTAAYDVEKHEMYLINDELDRREREEREAAKKAAQIASIADVTEQIKVADYALVSKTYYDFPNVIYRKAEMKAVAFGAYDELRSIWYEKAGRRRNFDTVSDYKIVEASKLKPYQVTE